MPIAEFCEREYEANFNCQIPKLHRFIWTPGQIQEHFLGFDAAFLSSSRLIFGLFPFLQANPSGIHLSPIDWQQIFELADRQLPECKFNLFVQHKRPVFIGSPLGKEYTHWNHSYFRYQIDPNQQAQLEKLETIAGSDALVTYACAAFHKYQELWEHTTNSTLIRSSNFVRPADLIGHDRYSFDAPGSEGWATSEPEFIQGQEFAERVREYLDIGDFTLSEIIKRAGKIVQETMRESEVSTQLFDQVLSDTTTVYGIEEDSVLYSYITVQAFCFQNCTSWSIVAQEPM